MPAVDYYFQRDLKDFRQVTCEVCDLEKFDKITETHNPDGGRTVELAVTPNVPIPAAAKAAAGIDKFAMVDLITYPPRRAIGLKAPFKMEYGMRSPIYPDSVSMKCEIVIEEIDANSCRQSIRGECVVSIWGWSTIVETIVNNAVHNGYSKLDTAVKKWKGRRGWVKFFHALLRPRATDCILDVDDWEIDVDCRSLSESLELSPSGTFPNSGSGTFNESADEMSAGPEFMTPELQPLADPEDLIAESPFQGSSSGSRPARPSRGRPQARSDEVVIDVEHSHLDVHTKWLATELDPQHKTIGKKGMRGAIAAVTSFMQPLLCNSKRSRNYNIVVTLMWFVALWYLSRMVR